MLCPRWQGSGVRLAIEPGQHAAASRALEKAYQGDLAAARRECWTVGAKLAVFFTDADRGAELWPDLAGEWQRMTA